MTADYLRRKFDAAHNYADYIATGTDEQQRRWKAVEPLVHLTQGQQATLAGFVRTMNVLCISGIWCGDCVQQGPLLDAIARANPEKIVLRFIDRDAHKDLSDQVKLNGGSRVPTVLFLADDYELCGLMGDRTLHRYRAIAARQLGPACPVGIAPPDADEVAATVADWANEFERIQLMLRLSPRLRQRYGD